VKRVSLVIVFAALALMVFTRSAVAANIATYIAPQSDSPVQITGCYAGVRFVSNGWGTHFSMLDVGVSFRNDSPKTAVAVLTRFELSSVFGDVMGNLFGQSAGQFATGVAIDGNKWSNTDTWPGLGIVRCSVSRVLFADGSVWTATGMPTPTPGPGLRGGR
jgi:hypothetical protein